MTKHTPGPWRYLVDPEGKFGIYPEGGGFLAITDHEANARLIAAVPELLEAAKGILLCSALKYQCSQCMTPLEAAIAKAEGKLDEAV